MKIMTGVNLTPLIQNVHFLLLNRGLNVRAATNRFFVTAVEFVKLTALTAGMLLGPGINASKLSRNEG